MPRILFYLTVMLSTITASLAVYAETLMITTARGERYSFDVEIAATPRERQIGLMYRDDLAPYAGMLFDFKTNQPVSMWMANTYISLDILFIRDNGVIHHIVHQAIPQSRDSISSRGRVRSVLEIAGGSAKRLGIRPGDRISHPLFNQ